MKTNKTTIFGMILFAVTMLFAAGCTKPDEPNNGGNNNGGNGGNGGGGGNNGGDGSPKIETVAPFSITSTSAKSGGVITDQGSSRIVEQGICWNTSGNPVVDNSHATATVGEESFTCTMTDLTPSTTYYVRAYAINISGVGYGEARSFTTEANGGGGGGNNNESLPVVETAEVSSVSYNHALCGGNVIEDGGSTVTERGVCWSTHQEPTIADFTARNGSGLGNYTANMGNLSENTTYYVRAYASNSSGTGYGEQRVFTTSYTPEPPPQAPTGAIRGLFSVSPTKQVWFSQGNLQYNAAQGTHQCADGTTKQGTWRFATNSFSYVGGDYVGNAHHGNVSGSSNNNVSSTYSGWIDLFSWGTSGWNNGNHFYQPYNWKPLGSTAGEINNNSVYGYGYGPTDGSNYDYDLTGSYAYSDWGVYNAISNGGNQPGLWRTLLAEEWDYLCNERSCSTVNGVDNARFVLATLNSQTQSGWGIILFPDYYIHPDGVKMPKYINKNTNVNSIYDENTFTLNELNLMQEAGCVYMPVTGWRRYNSIDDDFELNSWYVGDYWTASNSSTSNGSAIRFYLGSLGDFYKYNGYAVRLVQDR